MYVLKGSPPQAGKYCIHWILKYCMEFEEALYYKLCVQISIKLDNLAISS